MVSGEYMKRITLRLPDDLHDKFVEIANKKDRSLNAQIIRALRHYLAMEKHTDITNKSIEELRDIADVQEADLDLTNGEIEDFDIDELRKKI